MRIAVNTRLLLSNRLEGIGWFTFQTLKRITRTHPEHQFFFLFDRAYDPQFIFSDNITPVVIPPPTRHPLLWLVWFEYAVPFYLKKIRPDLFLSPDGFIPLSLKIPVIPVIHDINFQHRPKDLPWSSRVYYRHYFPEFALQATRIATVSEYSRSDIAASYRIDPEKIDVVYNGSHELYKPISDREKQLVKAKYTGQCDYFIYVGSLHPRKNIEGLLKGFDLFKKQISSNFKLLIVGEKMFMNAGLDREYQQMSCKEDIIFTGRKEPEELSALIAAAWALAFVPFFEGFGIPLLEAMNCDVPAVASDVTSLPEIAGETAIYVQPGSVQSIADGLGKMAQQVELREQLKIRCREQRLKFSWDITAAKLWQTIDKCLIK